MIDQETLNVFDKLYNDTYNDILKYVVIRCSNINDVSDIMQNIYIEVYKKISNDIDVNKSYIIGIAKNKLKDYYRFNYKEKIVSLFKSKEDTSVNNIKADIDLEKALIVKYDVELVWDYLKKKKVIISKVFYLYFQMGLTIKEIAKELEITESNVKHYLYRTLKELNDYLKRGDNDA